MATLFLERSSETWIGPVSLEGCNRMEISSVLAVADYLGLQAFISRGFDVSPGCRAQGIRASARRAAMVLPHASDLVDQVRRFIPLQHSATITITSTVLTD